MAKNNQEEKTGDKKEETNKLLRGILFAFLDGKERDRKAEILRQAGFNKMDVLEICGPSETTLRTRKHKAKKKQEKQKVILSKVVGG